MEVNSKETSKGMSGNPLNYFSSCSSFKCQVNFSSVNYIFKDLLKKFEMFSQSGTKLKQKYLKHNCPDSWGNAEFLALLREIKRM